MVAGIDIGSTSHFVAIPEGLDDISVRQFKSFTQDLYELAAWLKKCGITTVAMESTGVYWIPAFEILEAKGFDVKLVDARHVKNVSGRKTDVLDCQWLQQLHTYGLLQGAFRPHDNILELRTYFRQRQDLTQQAAAYIQRMQKAMMQMNVQLHHVISDITGETGMNIVRAIVKGERDPSVLAKYRHHNCKNSVDMIEKALQGNYRPEHLFVLQQSLEMYDLYRAKVSDCEREIVRCLAPMETKGNSSEKTFQKSHHHGTKNKLSFDAQKELFRITGVDLTEIPGIEASTALRFISETGLDFTRWRNAKQFASWLGLCPGNKVSGGKSLSGKTKRTSNRAASALRLAASTLHHSKSALGAFFRRLKARLGPAKATTAGAHKLAVIIFNMLTKGQAYVEMGQEYYEERYKERMIRNLTLRARNLGFSLSPNLAS